MRALMPENVDESVETIEPTEISESAETVEPAETGEEQKTDEDFIAGHLEAIREEEPVSNDGTSSHELASAEGFLTEAYAEEQTLPQKHTARNVLLIIVAILLVIAAGLAAWVYVVEKKAEGLVPAGVTFAQNTSLAQKDEAAVKSTIDAAAQELLAQTLIISSPSASSDSIEANSVSKPLSELVKIDTEKMTQDALNVREDASLIERLKVDILNQSIEKNIPYLYAINEDALSATVKDAAKANDQKAVNATLKQEGGALKISGGTNGFTTNQEKLKADIEQSIKEALEKGITQEQLNVTLEGETTSPKKTAADLQSKPAIIVTLSRRSVELFNGTEKVKTYRCAIGTPDHPTPVGNWKIVLKRKNPTWVNPGSEWAKSMPKTIGPGPTNPLGMRALNLNASGIRLHGTTSLGSIGTAASHGCMRMRNEDIIDLFDRVEVGTPVFIIP